MRVSVTVFSELFGGGKGELTLSDPSNVLESGIEIIAQLPGKGSQNIESVFRAVKSRLLLLHFCLQYFE